jgi:hypothetical protein
MPTTMTERDLSRPHSSIDESWGMLIHDVRNPQATVHACVQLLRRRGKNAPIDVLAQSVRAAARGEVQFSPADARLLVRQVQEPMRPEHLSPSFGLQSRTQAALYALRLGLVGAPCRRPSPHRCASVLGGLCSWRARHGRTWRCRTDGRRCVGT